MNSPPGKPSMTWDEALAPVLGMCLAAVVCLTALTLDTLLAGVASTGKPGAVLDWLPLAGAAVALVVALRAPGTVREAALAATVTFLALLPLLHPAPQPWMYAAPFLAAVVALGVTLAPTTRAVAAMPALAGLLAALELLAQDGLATILGAVVLGAYLLALWLELPSVALPSVAARASADARETGEQA